MQFGPESNPQTDVPIHFKSYSIQDHDIFCEGAKRILDTYGDGVYEGPAKVKEVNLVGPRDTSKSDRKSTRLNSSHSGESRMPSSA